MFGLPPVSPFEGALRPLLGPALSLGAICVVLSTPGWILDVQRTCVESLGSDAYVCANSCGDVISRAYSGTLLESTGTDQSGLSSDIICTHFKRTPSGKLEGWYEVSQNGGIYKGSLSGCEEEAVANSDSHFYHFRWRDQYGTGDAEFVFEPDYSGFNGSWGSDENPNWTSSWSGSRR